MPGAGEWWGMVKMGFGAWSITIERCSVVWLMVHRFHFIGSSHCARSLMKYSKASVVGLDVQ